MSNVSVSLPAQLPSTTDLRGRMKYPFAQESLTSHASLGENPALFPPTAQQLPVPGATALTTSTLPVLGAPTPVVSSSTAPLMSLSTPDSFALNPQAETAQLLPVNAASSLTPSAVKDTTEPTVNSEAKSEGFIQGVSNAGKAIKTQFSALMTSIGEQVDALKARFSKKTQAA